MKFRSSFMFFAVACVVAGSALAEMPGKEWQSPPHLDGVVYISAGGWATDGEVTGLSGSGARLAFDASLHIGDAWSVSFGGSYIDDNANITLFDSVGSRLNVSPRYSFGNGAYVGAYAQRFRYDPSVDDSPMTFTGKGVYAGYDTGTYVIEGYAGRTTLTTAFLGGSISANNLGIAVSYQPTDRLFVSGHYGLARVSGGEGADMSIVGIGAEYSVGRGWSVFGGGTSSRILEAPPIRQITVGAGYETAAFPGRISVDLTRTATDIGWATNRYILGWTIPLGRGPSRSQNCVMRNTRGQNRAPLVATMECAVLPFAISPG